MKAKLGNDIVEVWEISDEVTKNDWVKEAFKDKKIFWNNENGRVSTLQKLFDKDETYKTIPNKLSKTTLVVPAAFVNSFGMIGDYLVYNPCGETKYSILSKHSFDKECQIIEEDKKVIN